MAKEKNKKAEEALRENQQMLKDITEHLDEVVFLLDNKFQILHVNPAYEKIWGRTVKSLYDDPNSWLEAIHPDDLRKVNAASERQKTTGGEFNEEFRIKQPGGAIIWISDKLIPITDSSGKLYRLVGIVNDITERKKAEEKIRYQSSLLENMNDGVIATDMNGTITHWNKGSEKMFGWKAKEALGKHISLIYPPKDKDFTLQKMKEIIQKENSAFEAWGVRKDGTSFLRNASVSVLKNEKNQQVGFVGISTDISQIKKLEKEKRLLSEKVAKLTKKIPLTDNEKLVFYGLVKCPLLNDQQLSDKLKIKRSTVTAIKNKLLRQDFYSTYAIPNFELIGCELMCILNGKIPIEGNEKRKNIDIKKVISSPEVVHDLRTDKDFLSIIISKNFADAKRIVDYVSMLYDGGNVESPGVVYFPFAISRIINLFDYSDLLKSIFNLNMEDKVNKPIKSTKNALNDNEKIILYALTKYPDLTDTEIAAKTKISRQMMSLIKKSLIKENFIKIMNIPDVNKLDCELLLYSLEKINPKRFTKKKQGIPWSIFMVTNGRENSGIFIFENYTKYKQWYDKQMSLLKKDPFIIEEPKRDLFPTPQIKFQKMAFAPLVKKIFELKVNF